MADQLNIPAGVQITSSPRGIAIHHKGDIVLGGALGSRIALITSTDGSITLIGEHQVEEIRSERGSVFLDGNMRIGRVVALGGNVAVHGEIQAEEVTAPAGSVALSGSHRIKKVHAAEDLSIEGTLRGTQLKGGLVKLNAERLEVGAIEGALRVDLGEGTYKVEVVIAPHIEVHPKSEGRINVIESNNELGPTNLKGRFRLAEYAEFTGIDPHTFLQEREVRSLAQLGQPVAVAARPMTDELPTQQVPEDLDDLLEIVPEPLDGGDAIEPAHVGPPVALTPDALEPLTRDDTDLFDVQHTEEVDEDEPIAIEAAADDDDTFPSAAAVSTRFMVGRDDRYEVEDTINDTLDASVDAVFEAAEAAAEEDEAVELSEEQAEVQRQIREQVLRLSGLFRQDEPQGVARLRRYVSTERYVSVGEELPQVFDDVLRTYLKSSQRLHHLVVPTFNRIHSLVGQLQA